MDYLAVLKTIGGVVSIASPVAGTALATISALIDLATTAAATADDAKRAYDLISGHVDGAIGIEAIETEIETLEARGLKPIVPPEN